MAMQLIGNSMLSFLSLLKPSSIKDYALIIAVILIGLMSLLWQLEKARHRATTSEYALFVAKIASLGEIQKAKNEAEIKERENITDNVIKSYETKVKEVHQYYEDNPNVRYITINRLPVNTSSSGMPTESESTTGTNAGLDRVEETTTTVDLLKAGQEVVQCLELIEFTKQQDAVQ